MEILNGCQYVEHMRDQVLYFHTFGCMLVFASVDQGPVCWINILSEVI